MVDLDERRGVICRQLHDYAMFTSIYHASLYRDALGAPGLHFSSFRSFISRYNNTIYSGHILSCMSQCFPACFCTLGFQFFLNIHSKYIGVLLLTFDVCRLKVHRLPLIGRRGIVQRNPIMPSYPLNCQCFTTPIPLGICQCLFSLNCQCSFAYNCQRLQLDIAQRGSNA